MERRPVELPDFEVFRTVFYYCFVIIVMPVVSFFVSKFLIFDGLGLTDTSSNVYAAVTAIVVLHIALGMFVYRAHQEVPMTAAKPSKQD